MDNLKNLLRQGRTLVRTHIDNIRDRADQLMIRALKHASYRKVGNTHLYAVRNDAGLELLLREEAPHVRIEQTDYPEVFPTFLLLTNDMDDPFVFIPVPDMRDVLTFASIK